MCKTVNGIDSATLPWLEKAVLWALRAWVIGLNEKVPVEEQIQDAFVKMGAPDAAGQLYGLMWALCHGASREIHIDCVCSKRITADESSLLDVLALYQDGRSLEGLFTLRDMLTPQAAIAAGECALEISRALTAAYRTLTPRVSGTRLYAFAGNPPINSGQFAVSHILH